jgi:hypothetical protein
LNSVRVAEDLASIQTLLAGKPHNRMSTIEVLQLLPLPGA